MEYGYEISNTAGSKTFFVEGCTYCSMSTGGLHEQHCPLWKQQRLMEIRKKSHTELGNAWRYLAAH